MNRSRLSHLDRERSSARSVLLLRDFFPGRDDSSWRRLSSLPSRLSSRLPCPGRTQASAGEPTRHAKSVRHKEDAVWLRLCCAVGQASACAPVLTGAGTGSGTEVPRGLKPAPHAASLPPSKFGLRLCCSVGQPFRLQPAFRPALARPEGLAQAEACPTNAPICRDYRQSERHWAEGPRHRPLVRPPGRAALVAN